VLGVGLGVPGELPLWNDGGGLPGTDIDGAWNDGAAEDGTLFASPEL
jgi:hypothetical protein